MSKGKVKPKLSDYSHLVLNNTEKEALSATFVSLEQHSIVTAILGYVSVEHELDLLLRQKFRRRDDKTWKALLDESGPLRTFAAKITAGYAFGIYNEKLEHDLNRVRVIRNAFAHSKKLLDFDDELIVPELLKTHYLTAVFKKELRKKKPTAQIAKASYIFICLRLGTKLIRVRTRALGAANYRFRRKFSPSRKSPLINALLGHVPYAQPMFGLAGLGMAQPPESSGIAPGLNLLLSPASHSDNPTPAPPLGSPPPPRRAPPKRSDKEGK
jgi:DNA-binding MltR family transcriptional regulator